MAQRNLDCVLTLERAGIDYGDALHLRRIAMTLHRWHEMECGMGTDDFSECITRGFKKFKQGVGEKGKRHYDFLHDENGDAYIERHFNSGDRAPAYIRIADREKGAKTRLAQIMKKYPKFRAYIQTDPRGAALYIVPLDRIPEGQENAMDMFYSRGMAVYK